MATVALPLHGGIELALPNQLTLELSSPAMRSAARYVIDEIFVKQRYTRPGFELREDDVVVDVGANMGLFTLWAAPQVPRGAVLAIEPTSAFHSLEANVLRNGLEHVIPVQAAVGPDGEEFSITTYPGFNIVSHHHSWRPAFWTRLFIWLRYRRSSLRQVVERAPCVSLGKLIDDAGLERVNLLKIDCEGGEYEILRSMTDRDWARIERVAMEFHELAPGQDHRELVEILEEQGFDVVVRKPFWEYRLMRFGEIWASRKPPAAVLHRETPKATFSTPPRVAPALTS